MKEIKFTLPSLVERIEQVHGKIIEPFCLRYPSDYRCAHALRIYVKCEKLDMRWYEAEDGDYVKQLLGMDIVSFEWNKYSETILRVVVREVK
jgi:hypothetical protein